MKLEVPEAVPGARHLSALPAERRIVERLAGFKCPTGFSFVPELPRNATGKVVKSGLRERHCAGRGRRVS